MNSIELAPLRKRSSANGVVSAAPVHPLGEIDRDVSRLREFDLGPSPHERGFGIASTFISTKQSRKLDWQECARHSQSVDFFRSLSGSSKLFVDPLKIA